MISEPYLAIITSLFFSLLAFWRGYLTLQASLVTTLFGAWILTFAGFALAGSLGVCFFITAFISKLRDKKQLLSQTFALKIRRQAKRNSRQIIANGSVLVALSLLMGYFPDDKMSLSAAFLGCLAAVAGDTWASDFAHLVGSRPRLMTNGKRVAAGTPGAISPLGTLLTLVAGLVASFVYLILLGFESTADLPYAHALVLCFSAACGGFLGALFDSLLGSTLQAVYLTADGEKTDHRYTKSGEQNHYQKGWRWLNNHWVNFFNGLVGALTAYFIWTTLV